MPDEIHLNDEEEAALQAAEAKREQRQQAAERADVLADILGGLLGEQALDAADLVDPEPDKGDTQKSKI